MRTKKLKEVEVLETSLVLRVCREDYTSHKGFKWPSKVGAKVTAPDWKSEPECGNGLHGWLYGKGNCSLASYSMDTGAKWMVLEVQTSTIVDLGDKCKFPRAKVRFVGGRAAAADFIVANEPRARDVAVIGLSLKVGDEEVAEVGDMGTATAGEGGTAIVGNRGIATAGRNGRAEAGNDGTATTSGGGTATAGNRGIATAGRNGTATAGDMGMATAGYGGTATAGEGGTAMAGYKGTATVSHYGKATAGDNGTATAGKGSELRIQWWDSEASRFRTAIGYVGEGIKADTAYRLNDLGEFVEALEA